jgi:hypothetical protein
MKKLFQAEMSYKKWCILTIAISIGIILGAILLVFIVDPHYRYRDPVLYKKAYIELYAIAPQILKREDYDLLMLGTSMTRNFFIEDIDSAFHCRSVKLAAAGGTIPDLCKFFEIARKSKGDKLKRVVLSLDIYPFNKTEAHYKEFEYLYRDDYREEYKYFFSRQTYSTMLYLIKCHRRPKRERKYATDRNRMFSTEYEGKPYGLKAVMKDALHNEKIHHTQTPYNPEAHKENLKNMLSIFDENPQIEFIVYLPPYHIYTYCQSEFFGEADALIKQRRVIMEELLKRKNITLYDFQADRNYVVKHEYFSDVQHFSNVAAKKVLNDIVAGNRKITTPEQILLNEQELRTLIKENMPEYKRHKSQFER